MPPWFRSPIVGPLGPGLNPVLGTLNLVLTDLGELRSHVAARLGDSDDGTAATSRSAAFVADRKREVEEGFGLVASANDAEVQPYKLDLGRLDNSWQRLREKTAWGGLGTEPEPNLDPAALTDLRGALDALVLDVALFTIPKQIKSYMEDYTGAGSAFDFNEYFRKTLPSPVHRRTVLDRLNQVSPELIGGLVDPGAGLIYRIEPGATLVRSFGVILAPAALAAVALVVLVAVRGDGSGWAAGGLASGTQLDPVTLAVTFLASVGGLFAHIAKKAYEAMQIDAGNVVKTGAPVNLRRAVVWIHVRSGTYFIATVIVVIMFAAAGFTGQSDALVYFLGAYSIDSAAEVVLKRFGTTLTTRSGKAVETLTGRLE